MASPESSVPSTPSITITDDHGAGDALDIGDPLSKDRAVTLTFELPAEQHAKLVPRPAPGRATSADVAVTVSQLKASIDGASEQSTPKPTKKPELKQSASLRLLTNFGKRGSSTNLFQSKKTGSGGPSSANRSANQSGTSSPVPKTPEIQALFQKSTCPDLHSVNRALESLRLQAATEDDPYVSNLTRLAAQLNEVKMDCKKALTQAMKERDLGNLEICRALCITIIHHEHCEIDTKVYAYNILSTQASPGQAMNYLAEAWDLVKRYEGKRPDCEKLLGTIAMLKEGALEKDGNSQAFKANGKLRFKGEHKLSLEKAPTIPRDIPNVATVQDLLKVPKHELPKEMSGTLTPKTEKILTWAAED